MKSELFIFSFPSPLQLSHLNSNHLTRVTGLYDFAVAAENKLVQGLVIKSSTYSFFPLKIARTCNLPFCPEFWEAVSNRSQTPGFLRLKETLKVVKSSKMRWVERAAQPSWDSFIWPLLPKDLPLFFLLLFLCISFHISPL